MYILFDKDILFLYQKNHYSLLATIKNITIQDQGNSFLFQESV